MVLSAAFIQTFPSVPKGTVCSDESDTRRFVLEIRGKETHVSAHELGFESTQINNPISVCFPCFHFRFVSLSLLLTLV